VNAKGSINGNPFNGPRRVCSSSAVAVFLVVGVGKTRRMSSSNSSSPARIDRGRWKSTGSRCRQAGRQAVCLNLPFHLSVWLLFSNLIAGQNGRPTSSLIVCLILRLSRLGCHLCGLVQQLPSRQAPKGEGSPGPGQSSVGNNEIGPSRTGCMYTYIYIHI
jgi:hypothetical protein